MAPPSASSPGVPGASPYSKNLARGGRVTRQFTFGRSPFEVWLAIENKSIAPRLDYPPLHIVRFSGVALTEGIEEHVVDGVTVRITSVAKTVADCFKYRNKIGLDVALEALRDAWYGKRMTSDDLWRYAKICRVANVMHPYLDSLAGSYRIKP